MNSTCSVTCGYGILFRNRTGDSQIPSTGGKYCEGSSAETLECSLIDCPCILELKFGDKINTIVKRGELFMK